MKETNWFANSLRALSRTITLQLYFAYQESRRPCVDVREKDCTNDKTDFEYIMEY